MLISKQKQYPSAVWWNCFRIFYLKNIIHLLALEMAISCTEPALRVPVVSFPTDVDTETNTMTKPSLNLKIQDVSRPWRTQVSTTTIRYEMLNCKTEKLKSKSRYVRSNSKSLGNHVVSSEEEKERLRWEGLFCRKDSFKSGMKERVGDEKLIIIITNKCNCWGHKWPYKILQLNASHSCHQHL